MKKFMICAIALFLLLSTSVFGDTPPGNVQSTFKKMYPKANGDRKSTRLNSSHT